jgi:hypothetical protein
MDYPSHARGLANLCRGTRARPSHPRDRSGLPNHRHYPSHHRDPTSHSNGSASSAAEPLRVSTGSNDPTLGSSPNRSHPALGRYPALEQLLHARPQESSMPRYRGGQSEHPGHRQSENAHFWSPPAHLGFDAQPVRFSGDPQSRAFACVCCRRQISRLVKPPRHRLRPASALALSFTGAALLTSAAQPV